MVGADANKTEQLFAIGNRHGTDAGLFADDGGHARTVIFVETLHEDTDRAFGDAQRLGREGD